MAESRGDTTTMSTEHTAAAAALPGADTTGWFQLEFIENMEAKIINIGTQLAILTLSQTTWTDSKILKRKMQYLSPWSINGQHMTSLDPPNGKPSPWAVPRILVIVVLVVIADNSALASIIVSCLVSLSNTWKLRIKQCKCSQSCADLHRQYIVAICCDTRRSPGQYFICHYAIKVFTCLLHWARLWAAWSSSPTSRFEPQTAG